MTTFGGSASQSAIPFVRNFGVATIAQAKALILTDDDSVSVSGVDAMFHYDAGSSETADDVNVLAPAQGGRLIRSRPLEHFRVEMWGDTPADDTDNIKALLAYVEDKPWAIWNLYRFYTTDEQIVIGDGTDTAVSTVHHGLTINLRGNSAVGPGEYGSGFIAGLKWIGADSFANPVFEVRGGLHSANISMYVDCDDLALIGIRILHDYRSRFPLLGVSNSKAGTHFPIELASRDNAAYITPYTAGTTQGAMDSVFGTIIVRDPPASGQGNCIKMSGGRTNNVGFSRQIFEKVVAIRGPHADSIGVETEYMDNNTFLDLFSVGTGATPATGIAWSRVSPSGDSFNKENVVLSSKLVGTVRTVDETGADTTDGGHDLILGLCATDDGAPSTLGAKIHALRTDGLMIGGWAGTEQHFSVHLPALAASVYAPPIGTDIAANSSSGSRVWTAPCGGFLVAIRTEMDTAPGGSETRTNVLQLNEVDTALTTFYNSGESGGKADYDWLEVEGGDTVQWNFAQTGSAATTDMRATFTFVPFEVVSNLRF